MKEFIKLMNDLPWIVKLILCIPALNIVWAIYRIVKGVSTQNLVLTVIGILWIVPGSVICWIFDLVTVLLYKHPKLT